jgi:RHS repeat-associated protein
MVRFQDPAQLSNPVVWQWQHDSLGQVLQLSEPLNAPQRRNFSDWGELKEVISAPPLEPKHIIATAYDAYGRVIAAEERHDGLTDPDTVMKYYYDDPGSSPLIDPTYVRGRLAAARSPRGDVVFSYDAFGRVVARSFVDSTQSVYVEQHGFHADGSRSSIELNLPDNKYNPERVDYAYDTSGLMRWMWYSDGVDTEELYQAKDIDAWGRLRAGLFGRRLQYSASYAQTGRRLPIDIELRNDSDLRRIEYKDFDPIGRELARYDSQVGSRDSTYDALGRLSSSTTGASQWGFTYDPLGNATTLVDQLTSYGARIRYQTGDRDRVCRIDYSGFSGWGCNVRYDSSGGIISYPTRTGTNTLEYFNSGAVRSIQNAANATATFKYDAFGNVQELEVHDPTTDTHRSERRIGSYITWRNQKGANAEITYLSRAFPGPNGAVSRRGSEGPWIFQFSELRGVRFNTDHDGTFVQDVDYTPYGEASSNGAEPGTAEFSPEQWNDGDGLEPFGLVHLGARLYDPQTGRFLSRDPLLIPRSAATSNPYSFAFNDPTNFADPTGADPDPWGLWISKNFFSMGDSQYGLIAGAAAIAATFYFYGVPSSPFGMFSPAGNVAYEINYNSHLSSLVYGPIGLPGLSNGDDISALMGGALRRAQEYGSQARDPLGLLARTSSAVQTWDFVKDPAGWGRARASAVAGQAQAGINAVSAASAGDWTKMLDFFGSLGVDMFVAAATERADIPPAARGIGLGVQNTMKAVRTASDAYKGTTRLGHALSKHAGRRPDIWGKVTGNPSTWHQQGLQHFRTILRSPGEFQRVTNSHGTAFLEKMLPDGRGVRLQLDYTFKGFID